MFVFEQIQEFIELEEFTRQTLANTLRNSGRILGVSQRLALKASLGPGQRLIQRNWEKNPLTGKVRFLPEQSESPDESSDESSGPYIMLDVPDNNPIIPVPKRNPPKKEEVVEFHDFKHCKLTEWIWAQICICLLLFNKVTWWTIFQIFSSLPSTVASGR